MPVFIAAEIGVNWNGDRSRIPAFIEAAKQAGATAAKFQAYNTDKLVARRGISDPKPIDLLRRCELTDADLALIEECSHAFGIRHFWSVFDPLQVERVLSRGACCLKIGHKEAGWDELVDACLESAIKRLCNVYVSNPVKLGGIAVHCVAEYPATTPPKLMVCGPHNGLGWDSLGRRLPIEMPGFSSHYTDYRIPAAAALRGAEYIEFHLKLSDNDPEAAWSLSVEDATKCCALIKEFESWL